MRAVLVCAFVAVAARAYADDELAEARRLEAALDYEKALAIVDRMIARGGADPAQLVELHLFAGRLAAGLDRASVAEDHFARVLALRPAAALPAGTSPKLTAPFEAARGHAQALSVKAAVNRGLVTLDATPDPLGLVRGIAVHVTEGGQHRDIVARGALRVVVPEAATIVEISALDASGNRVWVGPPPPRLLAPVDFDHPRVVVHHEPAWYGRWSTYTIAGGVALAAGGFAAWRLDVAQTDFDTFRKAGGHDYSELTALASRGDRWALAANIGFGVAGAALVTALIVGIANGGGDETVTATPGGATLAVRF